MQQGRRWLPGRELVLAVDGGFAAVALALACVKSQMRRSLIGQGPTRRASAAQTHQGEPSAALASLGRRLGYALGDRDRGLVQGPPQTAVGLLAHRAVATPGLPPVEIRVGIVCDPEGKLRMEAFFCTDLQAAPVQILAAVVMRWAVEVTLEGGRAQLGLATQRQGSNQAIARTTPVLLALFSLVTLLALRWSQDGQIPVPVTAWYHKAEPTFADGVALVRWHLWRARYMVNSIPEAESRQSPQEVLNLVIHGLPLAA
jgi:hypothetical protein